MNQRKLSSVAAAFAAAASAPLILFGSTAAHAVPPGNGIMQGHGFDACTAPSTSQMQAWWTGPVNA